MAKSPFVTVVIKDSTGRTSPISVYTQTSNGVDEFRGLARALARTLDNIIDGTIVDISVTIPFEPSFWDAVATQRTTECDVENKGRFLFVSEDGFTLQASVPTIRNSVIDDSTNLIDTGNSNVASFVTAMTSNFVDNLLNVVPTDARGSRLLRVEGAYQAFSSSRKQRSAIKLK